VSCGTLILTLADFDYFWAVERISNIGGWPQFSAIKENFTVDKDKNSLFEEN
jgi:hypothetical protein